MKFLKRKWLIIFSLIVGVSLFLSVKLSNKDSIAQIIPLYKGKNGGIELRDAGEYLRIGVDFKELDFIELYENDQIFLRLDEIPNASQEARFKTSLFNKDGKQVNMEGLSGCKASWARDFKGEWVMPMLECDLTRLKEIVQSHDLAVFLALGGTDMLNNLREPYIDKDLISIDINKSARTLGKQKLFSNKTPWKLKAITDKGAVNLVSEILD